MLDTIYFQDDSIHSLQKEVSQNRLSSCLLFHGPPATGKLSTALELFRAINCQHKLAEVQCTCQHCRLAQKLIHPDLLLIGPESFPEEVQTVGSYTANATYKGAFIFSVRKLLCRINTLQAAGNELRISSQVPALMRSCQEELDVLQDLTDESEIKESVCKLTEKCEKLSPLLPAKTPIALFRAIKPWCYIKPQGNKKCIIIDNADSLQDSSRNALLKILEEPPLGLRFVLITNNVSRIIPTILSRCTLYSFRKRNPEETSIVLKYLYGLETKVTSLEEFFKSGKNISPAIARRWALGFLSLAIQTNKLQDAALNIFTNQKTYREDFLQYLSATDASQKESGGGQKFYLFLEALCSIFRRTLRDTKLSAQGLYYILLCAREIRNIRREYEVMNKSPQLLIETLMYTFSSFI